MTFPLIPDSDERLHQLVEPFDFQTTIPVDHGGSVQGLVDRMFETMVNHGGAGLAANQCGLPYRMFVMQHENIMMAVFNPVIEAASDQQIALTEGCLSYPGLVLSVKRPVHIRLRHQSQHGVEMVADLDEWPARIALHETDHLDGIVFTSRVSKLKLDMAKKKLKSRL